MIMKRTSLIFVCSMLLLILIVFDQCQNRGNKEVTLDVNYSTPPKRLSDYHFFKGEMNELLPNNRVLPYDLITPLFSDYAQKQRFVWMPEGVSAKYTRDEVFDFPLGTVLIKNFYYPYDLRDQSKGRRIVETRLLIHKSDKWDALTYVWNEKQDDAELNIIGANRNVEWVDLNGIKMHDDYSVPNKNQCKGCHGFNGSLSAIGPKVRNLNHDYDYVEGRSNQLARWASTGYLTGFDAAANLSNKVAKWDDSTTGTVELRARAYLDVNCAHCHRPEGSANPSGLYLFYGNTDPGKLGVLKTPEAAGSGGGDFLYDIIPGHPESSILPYRMGNIDPGKMMPQIGRKLVHQEGLDLIKTWISSMPQKASIKK